MHTPSILRRSHDGQRLPPNPGDTLVFENDWVRVWSMPLEPGGMFDFHQHHHDYFALWPNAGRAQAQEFGDPEWSLSQEAAPGFVMFRTVGRGGPLPPHRVRNLEDHAMTHYIVELVGQPSQSPVPLPGVTNDRGRLLDRRTAERQDRA
ncbi:hypothetical protein BB31_39135 [Amycolatopsis lurida NRRL 2430]|uniref:Cupin n=1 Tax=Amycolatopsis lurida NRRL 2430 TaxID=1460371 RepID=A0A2P2FGG2_AMYLU|nr:hypothetical protein BB31_39135 [Amycolatopsis lurida NRRL 2430]